MAVRMVPASFCLPVWENLPGEEGEVAVYYNLRPSAGPRYPPHAFGDFSSLFR